MAKQKAVESLRESIRLLEIKQAEEKEILIAQFRTTYETLKPANLIKNAIKELTSSAELKGTLFESITALVSGFLTRKLMVGSKSNFLVRILGLIAQFGVTNLIARNAESIRDFILGLIDKFFRPEEEKEPETEARAE